MLLRNAVDAATSSKQSTSIDQHDFTVWISLLQCCESSAIICVAESAENHPTVDHIVVDVAVVDKTPFISKSGWCSDWDELKVPGFFERPSHLLANYEVWVLRIFLAVKQNLVFTGKASNDIHVTTGAEFVVVPG